MKELIDLLEFVKKRQELAGEMTKATSILSDGLFGPYRRPVVALYNPAFEEEARRLLSPVFHLVPGTARIYFELAQLFKFGINDQFPGRDIEIDYVQAAYWFLAAADCGHKEAILFLRRMVPQYFMQNVKPDDMLIAVVGALVEQAKLAKACQGETLEERKWREAANDFVIDAFLYPEEHKIDEFWLDTIGKYFWHAPGEETFRKNNVRPLFER